MVLCGIRKQIPIVAIATTAIFLNGCDVSEMAKKLGFSHDDITVYLPPTIKLQIAENQTGYITGYDECPDNLLSDDCVKVTPKTDNVQVNITGQDGHSWSETWHIKHSDKGVYFVRPDGFQIAYLRK